MKILHEFGSVSDEKVQGEDFSLNQNLTELAARRAYKKGLDTGILGSKLFVLRTCSVLFVQLRGPALAVVLQTRGAHR